MFYTSILMFVIFFTIAIIFYIFKGKACILIAGYNFKSKEERKSYDEERISKDYYSIFFKYSMIFLIGAVGCILISDWCFYISFILWILYLLKGCKSTDKMFDKYKVN